MHAPRDKTFAIVKSRIATSRLCGRVEWFSAIKAGYREGACQTQRRLLALELQGVPLHQRLLTQEKINALHRCLSRLACYFQLMQTEIRLCCV